MSPDLIALGDHLEAAVARALARRRARRTAFLNGAATIAVAVPLALAVATTDLTSSGTPASIGAAAARPALGWTPGFDLAVKRIPDERVLRVTIASAQCLDGNDCRVPIPFTLESPLGKV